MFNEKLMEIFDKYKIIYTKNQIIQFEKYYNLVIDWNKKINLTAIIDENEFIFKHILDSIFPYNIFSKNSRIIDVGAGAGFPSIPLKIMRPDLTIVMCDSLMKRINFLNLVIKELSLEKITATHSRAEDLATNYLHRDKYDYAVARAVAKLNTLAEYLLPFVRIGGEMIAYKSQNVLDEVSEGQRAFSVLGGKYSGLESYKIFEISADRKIVRIKKLAPTPNGYPRSGNKPKDNPIV